MSTFRYRATNGTIDIAANNLTAVTFTAGAVITGAITCTSITCSGGITSNSLNTGAITATTITFTSAAASSFINAASFAATGAITSATLTTSGLITSGSLTTGALTCTTITASGGATTAGLTTGVVTSTSVNTGAIACTTLTASGAVTSASLATGAITASTITFTSAAASSFINAASFNASGSIYSGTFCSSLVRPCIAMYMTSLNNIANNTVTRPFQANAAVDGTNSNAQGQVLLTYDNGQAWFLNVSGRELFVQASLLLCWDGNAGLIGQRDSAFVVESGGQTYPYGLTTKGFPDLSYDNQSYTIQMPIGSAIYVSVKQTSGGNLTIQTGANPLGNSFADLSRFKLVVLN